MSLDGERNCDTARMMMGHANTMVMHTGNVIDWFLLKKNRHSMISPDELMDGLNCVMKTWVRNTTHSPLIEEATPNLEISNPQLVKEIDPDLRKEFKISVKLFLNDTKPEIIRDAINKITNNLNVQRLDSVLVSFPLPSKDVNQKVLADNDYVPATSVTDFETVKAVWLELESCIKSGHVGQIGVCDFDQDSLQTLYDWAAIKPTVDQINLNTCCHVPNDLVQYATENGIELLTHNDPPEILPVGPFQSLIGEQTEDASANEWYPSFIARYAVLVKYRGIVHSKGYIVSADRHLPSQIEDFAFF